MLNFIRPSTVKIRELNVIRNNCYSRFLHTLMALPLVQYEAAGVASRFNVDLQAHCSTTTIKNAIWCSFIKFIEHVVF